MNIQPEGFNLPTKKIFLVGLGLVGVVAVIILILWMWQKSIETLSEVSPHPSPRLQVEFEAGILAKNAKAEQMQDLNSYGWQDSQHQFAKVPIERAMEAFSKESAQGGGK